MTTADSRVEHKQVAGWGGGLEKCGVVCACDTTFDGFDTLAEAVELLDRHIAHETSAAPEPEPQPEPMDAKAQQRAEYVAGLRALADLLEAHPELELPYTGSVAAINVILTGDEHQREQVGAWARVMSGRKNKSTSRDGHAFYLDGRVAGLPVTVIAERDEVCTRVVVGTREVVEEVPDPDALAAVPTVTVTKIVEDVDWVCHPILDDARVGAS